MIDVKKGRTQLFPCTSFFFPYKHHERRREHTEKPYRCPNEGLLILADAFALYGVFYALKYAVKHCEDEKYAEIKRKKAKIDQIPLITSAICSPP